MKVFPKSKRLSKLPPYLFVEIDRKKRALQDAGKDVIDLGIGDPDIPPSKNLIRVFKQAISKPENSRYPIGRGMLKLREAISRWHKREYNVILDPQKEIVVLIGSKEGVAHLPLAILNKGEGVLIPDPGYPPYLSGTIFADCVPYMMPLLEENEFLPDLAQINKATLKKSRLLFLNYPNNPTSSLASKKFFEDAVCFAKRHNLIIAQDAAYMSIYYDKKPPSFLEIPCSRDVGVEFYSFSKTFSVPGWRLGWVAGNESVLDALFAVKSNIDSGPYTAIQETLAWALDHFEEEVSRIKEISARRIDIFCNAIDKMGLSFRKPRATFYVWIKAPEGYSSMAFADLFLSKLNIVVAPGVGFGKSGEGYVRAALCTKTERIIEASKRLSNLRI